MSRNYQVVIEAKNIVRTFHSGSVTVDVLKGISLTVSIGEFVAIIGRSGAGKSTLLYQLGLLDHPTSGTVYIDGRDTSELKSAARTYFRLENLGFIFQDYAILPELTAAENVMVPLLMKGVPRRDALNRAREVLAKVGMEKNADHLPSQLSGGEQQRVSVARAIAHNPKILFADEPTANLDSDNGAVIIALLKKLNTEGITIVMVTHESEYAHTAHRIIEMKDGMIVRYG